MSVVAATKERRRALTERVEAAGYHVVESDAQLVLADADAPMSVIDDALRTAVTSVLTAVVEPVSVPSPPAPGFRGMAEAPASLLTARETEILNTLGDGMSNKEVARALGISAHTVKFHLETIFRKLGVTSRAEAVAKGLRQGIIEL
ncbi:MAG TPA: LuxR C-terminal-related transcriptional regulator [Magnetospirillaceae bacterium]